MDLGLSGKTALVVGATGDIGQAVARRLAQEGANVLAAGRDGGRMAALAGELGARCLGTLEVDLAHEDSITAAVNRAFEIAGNVDILVSAAVGKSFGSVWDLSRKDWEAIFRIKYMGTADVCRQVARRMAARREGVIVNLIGIATHVYYPTSVVGGDSNIATARFTRFLAAEMAQHNVRVLGVSPGFVDGRRLAGFFEAERRNLEATVPLGRVGRPDEIADLAAYLVSPRAAYMTGNIVEIDGGVSLHAPGARLPFPGGASGEQP
jgi:NAD(P)-dependent dehydrogenase (short-subunit alcohol dehydrogenase family)